MDGESFADKALAAFEAPDPATPGAPESSSAAPPPTAGDGTPKGAVPAPSAAPGAAPPAAAVPPAPAAAQPPAAAPAAPPAPAAAAAPAAAPLQVQDLFTDKAPKEIHEIFSTGAYPVKSLDDLKNQLADTAEVYGILDGKTDPDKLLGMVKQNYPQAFEKLKAVFAKELGQPGAVKDPVTARVEALEKEFRDKQAAIEAEKAQTQRVTTFNGLVDKTKALLVAVDPKLEEFLPDYLQLVTSLINGDKAILDRMTSGNYADGERLFTEVHNKLLRFAQTLNKSLVTQHNANKAPQIPGGGAPPPPAVPGKSFNAGDRDSRIAAATELL